MSIPASINKPHGILVPTKSEFISFSEYMALSEEAKENIVSSRVLPATLGTEDWGKLYVEYSTPVLRPRR